MKTLLSFALCLFAFVAQAANPSTKSFRATGGLVVTSNDITGIITYDGSGISSPTGGVSATTASNIARAAVLVAAGTNVTVVTNATGTNIIYTVSSTGSTTESSVTNIVQSFIGSSTNASGQAFTNLLDARTLFVDSETGNDATAIKGDASKPWRNAHIALLAALSGDIVFLREGIHDIGTNVFNIGHGVKVTGRGDGSVLSGSGGLLTNGPIVGLTGSTCEVSHITIVHSKRDYYQSGVIGFFNQATNGQVAGTNMVIHDLNLIGDSDSIYLRSTNSWTLRGNDIRSYSKWDNFVQFSESSNGFSRWASCYFESDLKGALNPQSLSVGVATAVKVQGGVAEFYNCSTVSTNGRLSTIGLSCSGGTTRWVGGIMKAAGTNSVLLFDVTGAPTTELIYYGNQISRDDGQITAIRFGSQMAVLTNLVYRTSVGESIGLVIDDEDLLNGNPVYISTSGGVNIGGLTDPGGARLQVGSLPGSGDYVAADANGLLFSTNAPAGGGTPGGSVNSVQFHGSGGVFAGDTNFQYFDISSSESQPTIVLQYGGATNIYSLATMGTRSASDYFLISSNTYRWAVKANGNFEPVTSNNVNVGSSTKPVAEVHAQSFYSKEGISTGIGTGGRGYLTLNDTNVVTPGFSKLMAPETVTGNVTHHLWSNSLAGVVVAQALDTPPSGSNQLQNIVLTPGQYVTFNGATYVASNLPSASAFPLGADANGAGFSFTNLLKLTLGGNYAIDSGTQNPALIITGTNSAGTMTTWRMRNTNAMFTLDSPTAPFAAIPLTLATNGALTIGGAFSSGANSISGGSVTGTALGTSGTQGTISPTTSGILVWTVAAGAGSPALGRTNGDMIVFGADKLYGGGNTNKLYVDAGVIYRTNTIIPSATQLGVGGFWTGNSNGNLVTVYSLDGSTTAMKVLAP